MLSYSIITKIALGRVLCHWLHSRDCPFSTRRGNACRMSLRVFLHQTTDASRMNPRSLFASDHRRLSYEPGLSYDPWSSCIKPQALICLWAYDRGTSSASGRIRRRFVYASRRSVLWLRSRIRVCACRCFALSANSRGTMPPAYSRSKRVIITFSTGCVFAKSTRVRCEFARANLRMRICAREHGACEFALANSHARIRTREFARANSHAQIYVCTKPAGS